MSLVFRSIIAGLIGVIPIVFSSVIVLGVMGIFNIPLNLITMTIIPILLGIGVDDSIHFINHIKFEKERCQSYREAILRSFRAVGYTLFITSFILIAIFSIYATSIVKMFVHFGFVSSAGVLAALIGTYLFIPVMIKAIKPFGKE
jgi:predicted RND superfamily exporter protein